MMLYFLFSNWFYTYEFNFLNGRFFNGRSRGLTSLLYWGSQMVGAFILSTVVEKGDKPNKKRAIHGFTLNTVCLVLSWSFAIAIQYTSCNGTVDKDHLLYPLTSEARITTFCTEQFIEAEKNGCINTAKKYLEGGINIGYDVVNPNSSMPKLIDLIGFEKNFDETCPDGCSVHQNLVDLFEIRTSYIPVLHDNDLHLNTMYDGLTKAGIPESFQTCAVTNFLKSLVPLTQLTGDLAEEDVFVKSIQDSLNTIVKPNLTNLVTLPRCARPYNKNAKVCTDRDLSKDFLDFIFQSAINIEPYKDIFQKLVCDMNDTSQVQLICSDCQKIETSKGNLDLAIKGAVLTQDFDKEKVYETTSQYKEVLILIVCLILMGISDAVFQVYALWLISSVSNGDVNKSTRYAAAYKGIQSLGNGISNFAELSTTFYYSIQLWVCMAFAVLSVLGNAFTIPMIKEIEVNEVNDDDNKSIGEKILSDMTSSSLLKSGSFKSQPKEKENLVNIFDESSTSSMETEEK